MDDVRMKTNGVPQMSRRREGNWTAVEEERIDAGADPF